MLCRSCGTQLMNGVSRCHACGLSVENNSMIANPETNINMNMPEMLKHNQLNNTANLYEKEKRITSEKKGIGLLVILVVLGILVAVILLQFLSNK